MYQMTDDVIVALGVFLQQRRQMEQSLTRAGRKVPKGELLCSIKESMPLTNVQ